ncbi:RlpA-like double-psi beta-barrel-protein domain-containing protein-containing protein, partial [Earliella scabrosa]
GPSTATWFTPDVGSCGQTNVESDFIVALDAATLQNFPGATANPNNHPLCGRKIEVTGPDGKSQVVVTIADTCPSEFCAPGSIDLTPAAFQELAPLDVGRLQDISWTL